MNVIDLMSSVGFRPGFAVNEQAILLEFIRFAAERGARDALIGRDSRPLVKAPFMKMTHQARLMPGFAWIRSRRAH